MSQDDAHSDALPDAGNAPTEAPKKKRGFWGWLTGRADDTSAPPPAEEGEATAGEPTTGEATEERAPQPAMADAPTGGSAEAATTDAATATAQSAPLQAASLQATPTPEAPPPEALPSEAPMAPAPEAQTTAGGVAASEEPVETAPQAVALAQPGTATPPTAPTAEDAVPSAAGVAAAPTDEQAVANVSVATEAPVEPTPLELEVEPPPAAPAPNAAQEPTAPPAPPEAAVATALTAPLPQGAGQEAGDEAEPEQPQAGDAEKAAAEAQHEEPEQSATEPRKKGFWARLASGLARTASNLGQGITDLVSKRKLDADTLEELEEVLIRADLGVETSMRIVEAVGKGRHDKMISPEEVKGLIAAEVERILEPVAKPLVVEHLRRPFVVLMVGVNGSGKTTTIGKLASQWRHEGKKVVLAAGDTFRAAAIDQLKVWGQRTGTKVIAKEPGADAAGVAHDALTEARADGADILMIDTAGRLQNRTELMAELEKIVRVVKKLEPSAPHAVLLVLDATVGQNALSQVEAFTRIAGVTGLVMTKLDGTARGGILVAIAAKHKLPVHLIGVGEGADDLQPFTARDFARAIAGLE
uniref:signal recognition particle-docking protein FtsY n=2 Tax=Xanthobacter variabilis TaxID=3119932 RepID=UPI00372D588C